MGTKPHTLFIAPYCLFGKCASLSPFGIMLLHGSLILSSLSLAFISSVYADLPPCSSSTETDFDYVVIGAGAGGGPLAARLAESGFSGENQ